MALFGLTTASVPGIASMKLFDALPIVVTIVMVARLGGMKPADLYLRKGKDRAWLAVGSVSFVAFTPWILLFVFCNAFMEELHFRGLLLRPCEQLLVLALAWGHLIQRTESLWGTVLFHAGADLMITLGIFGTYGVH
jgi:membrane protease YdiL (CAAX protease family)